VSGLRRRSDLWAAVRSWVPLSAVDLPSLPLLLLVLLLAFSRPAQAHEFRPGYLELREKDPSTFALLWKRPSGGEVEIRLQPVVPEGCRLEAPDRQTLTPGAVVVRGTLSCAGGLAGKTIRIAGLESTMTDVLVRIQHADGRVESRLLRPVDPAFTLGADAHFGQRALSYLQLGLQHILLGVDHLLFVLGLLLIVRDRWMLLKTVTAFTVAHSLTLAMATLGHASVPLPPLDAAVALSILFLGPEIVRVWRGQTSFTLRHPWVVAFAFGLLHGFGFASGLTAMGLPRAELPLALLLFNVGVEIGQLAFVAGVLLLVRAFRKLQIDWPRWQRVLPGYAVGSLGAYWTIQRVVVML
jgi:hydrogenase/urease accessory protein HupE